MDTLVEASREVRWWKMEEEFGTLGVKVARRILLHVDV